jgi:hypothetical protein
MSAVADTNLLTFDRGLAARAEALGIELAAGAP